MAFIRHYSNDIEESITNEYLHFRDHLCSNSDDNKRALELCEMLYKDNLMDVYPNVTIALRIFYILL